MAEFARAHSGESRVKRVKSALAVAVFGVNRACNSSEAWVESRVDVFISLHRRPLYHLKLLSSATCTDIIHEVGSRMHPSSVELLKRLILWGTISQHFASNARTVLLVQRIISISTKGR
eukprot:8332259-Pyramimonas_sp.AAC.1